MSNKIYPDSKVCSKCQHMLKIRETIYTLRVYCELVQDKDSKFTEDVGKDCPHFVEFVESDD